MFYASMTHSSTLIKIGVVLLNDAIIRYKFYEPQIEENEKNIIIKQYFSVRVQVTLISQMPPHNVFYVLFVILVVCYHEPTRQAIQVFYFLFATAASL